MGSVLLETALVMPIALILFVGVIDFGRAYYTLAVAQKSVRAAVRYLTTLPPSGLCASAGAVNGWGVDKSKNLALYGNLAGSGSVRIPGWSSTNFTITSSACPVAAGATIHVNATVPFTALTWGYLGLPKTMTMVTDYEGKWIGQ